MKKATKRFFQNSTNLVEGFRFFAKFFSIIIFLFFLIAIIIATPAQRSTFNPYALPFYDSIMVISFYFILLSLLIAWIKEGLGGLLSITGLIVYLIFDFLSDGKILWNILILAVPACMFIYCWWYTNVSEEYDPYRE